MVAGVIGVCVTGEWVQVLLVCVLQVNGCRCYRYLPRRCGCGPTELVCSHVHCLSVSFHLAWFLGWGLGRVNGRNLLFDVSGRNAFVRVASNEDRIYVGIPKDAAHMEDIGVEGGVKLKYVMCLWVP